MLQAQEAQGPAEQEQELQEPGLQGQRQLSKQAFLPRTGRTCSHLHMLLHISYTFSRYHLRLYLSELIKDGFTDVVVFSDSV